MDLSHSWIGDNTQLHGDAAITTTTRKFAPTKPDPSRPNSQSDKRFCLLQLNRLPGLHRKAASRRSHSPGRKQSHQSGRCNWRVLTALFINPFDLFIEFIELPISPEVTLSAWLYAKIR